MLFKQNDINLSNYEEYFILYMDRELSSDQQLMVEAFISRHPHLAEELDVLLSTKLPLDAVSFSGKEELLSSNMKMNLVDENLLLYIDNELNASEKASVEEKLKSDKDFSLQHLILMQTKLDASEKVLHPNKKELYRHEERIVAFKVWMRVAAAVILLLLGSLFFLTNSNKRLPAIDVANQPANKTAPVDKQEKVITPVEQLIKEQAPVEQDAPVVIAPVKKAGSPVRKDVAGDMKNLKQDIDDNIKAFVQNYASRQQTAAINSNVGLFTNQPQIIDFTVSKTITRTSVTSQNDSTYNKQNNPMNNPEVDWAVETQKKTPAKGFFRKVSRFIERNTGIGTVNADNELLIGAVALKLK